MCGAVCGAVCDAVGDAVCGAVCDTVGDAVCTAVCDFIFYFKFGTYISVYEVKQYCSRGPGTPKCTAVPLTIWLINKERFY